MLGVASYSLIERRLIMNDPCRFYCELKYNTVNEVFVNLKGAMTIGENDYEVLYEEVMKVASNALETWEELICNSKELKLQNYLTKLDICLRTLTKNGYIKSNYLTRFNSKKEVLDLKIVELEILTRGKTALDIIDNMKNTAIDNILRKSIIALSNFVEKVDIIDFDRDVLIDEFKQICESVSDVKIIDFDHDEDRNFTFNHYKGRFEVSDIEELTKFINQNNNFELERIIKEFLHRSIIEMYDLRVLINALAKNQFETIYNFMRIDDVLRHLSYLADRDYVRLDYSYSTINAHQYSEELKLHSYIITELGSEYLANRDFIEMKQSRMIASEIVRGLQVGIKQKNYREYFSNDSFIKRFIHFT